MEHPAAPNYRTQAYCRDKTCLGLRRIVSCIREFAVPGKPSWICRVDLDCGHHGRYVVSALSVDAIRAVGY